MAAGTSKKKTNKSNKAASHRKKTSRGNASSRKKNVPADRKGIAGIVLFVIGILALAAQFVPSTAGFFYISKLFFRGFTGRLCMLLPVVLCLVGVGMVFFTETWGEKKYIISGILLFLFLETLLEAHIVRQVIATINADGKTANYWRFLLYAYKQSSRSVSGGGLIGAFLAYPLFLAFDAWGSTVVLIFAMLITVMVVTGVSFGNVGIRLQEFMDDFLSGMRDRREEKLLAREEREKRKEEEEEIRLEEEKRIAEERKRKKAELAESTEPDVSRKNKKVKLPEEEDAEPFFEAPVLPFPETVPYNEEEKEETVPSKPHLALTEDIPLYIERDTDFERRDLDEEYDREQDARPFTIDEAEDAFRNGLFSQKKDIGKETRSSYARPISENTVLRDVYSSWSENHSGPSAAVSAASAKPANGNASQQAGTAAAADLRNAGAAVSVAAAMEPAAAPIAAAAPVAVAASAAAAVPVAAAAATVAAPVSPASPEIGEEQPFTRKNLRRRRQEVPETQETAVAATSRQPAVPAVAEPVEPDLTPIEEEEGPVPYSIPARPSYPSRPAPQGASDSSPTSIHPSAYGDMSQANIVPAERVRRMDGSVVIMPKKDTHEIEPIQEPYIYPPMELLHVGKEENSADIARIDMERGQKLLQTLSSFGVQAKLLRYSHGPAITRFELQPAPGVKVSRIVNLVDDIALNMASEGVRIEAPIPGKAAVGIEVPNQKVSAVTLRDVLDTPEMRKEKSPTAVALGKGISGMPVIADIAKMPHVLIAGATGSGKSVCINTIINSIIFRASPDEVKLILVDPKVVELSVYNGIPHLLIPVVTDPKKASAALDWAVVEMERRYKRFESKGVRNISGYNNKLAEGEVPMFSLVVIIDELADLMMVAPGEVEDSICRLAQLARAAGIHLVIATQRPSVNVITGVIKANIPSRIAFAVSSSIDSRTILDTGGAEKLLGRGDMLYAPQGASKPTRVQGCFVTDDEVQDIVDFVKEKHQVSYDEDIIEQIQQAEKAEKEKSEERDEQPAENNQVDELLNKAIDLAVEAGQVSISMLQRRLRIGYARAGRLVDEMTLRGIASESEGSSKPRNVLITREQWQQMQQEQA